ERVVLDFMPDIVHINDYVNMSARIIQHLSDAGCVVVREIWNDEEICFRISPIIQEDQNICPGPEKPSQCAECYFKKSFDVNAHSRICIDGKIYTHMKYVGHLYERKVDGVIFPCESFKEHFTRFIHIDEDKIEVIPHGIGFAQDQNFAERKKPDRPIFTFLGCIDFRKGVDILLKAFENIVDTDDFELRIYGNVANMGYVNQAKELELKYPGKIKYHGPYEPEDVPRIMEETDVGIVPSYFETYCCVLREFLVHGVPVICTDFFGSDIVQDGVNGLKIPVGKDRSLGQKMKSLLKNPKLITELKRGAKNTRIPTHEEEISDLLKFYEKLLKQEKQVDVQETLYDGLVGSPARNAAHFDQDPSYAKLKQLYVEKIQEAKAKDTYISRLQKVGRYDQKSIQAGLERIQKLDGALPVLKRVLDRMKRENVSSETLTEVGELCFCMGLSEHALYFFEKAIAVHQTNGRALNNLGVLAFQIEDFQTAREFFERALQISPNDQDAQDNLAALSNETNLMRRSADARTSSSSGAVLTIREGLKRVLGTVQSSGLGGDRVVQ
nr:glycosyltransferase [Candidatus Aminicenantes bacterium]